MEHVISFTKVQLAYGWLGNMFPHPVNYKGDMYGTNEALFQSLRFSDEKIREAIRAERSPMGAKMVAKRNIGLATVTPQSPEDLDNMRLVLRIKVEQHSCIARWLLETGEARIVEDCTARQGGSGLFWGAAKQADGSWVGQNWLGVLWQELRSDLRRG